MYSFIQKMMYGEAAVDTPRSLRRPMYVGQRCFDLDREGSLSKRLNKLSTSMEVGYVAGYLLDVKPLPISDVCVCK